VSRAAGFFLFDWWNNLMVLLPGDDFPLYQEQRPMKARAIPKSRRR
jgi:hypothetical protein